MEDMEGAAEDGPGRGLGQEAELGGLRHTLPGGAGAGAAVGAGRGIVSNNCTPVHLYTCTVSGSVQYTKCSKSPECSNEFTNKIYTL